MHYLNFTAYSSFHIVFQLFSLDNHVQLRSGPKIVGEAIKVVHKAELK